MILETFVADVQIYKGYCVSLSPVVPGRVTLTDWNDSTSVSMCIGIANQDAYVGANVDVCIMGVFENLSWTLTPNKPVYVFAMGTVTQDLPFKNVYKIGLAVTPTKIFVKPSEFIMVTA